MTNRNISETAPSIERRVDDIMQVAGVIEKFMDIKRATTRHGREETDGEHTLRLQFIAVAYAAQYHPELDVGKVAQYALVHDLIEVYAGDVNSLTASAEAIGRKALIEKLALDRLADELSDTWPYLIDLVLQYEELADSEARFVKCFDKCDPSLSHCNDGGRALLKMGVLSNEQFAELHTKARVRIEEYGYEFPDVMQIREELVGRVANITFPTV